MIGPRLTALSLLVLLAPTLVAGRSLSENDALKSMQEQCLDTAAIDALTNSVGGYHGLNTTDCERCMAQSNLIDRAHLMWPCTAQVCQNTKFFTSAYPAAPDNSDFQCATCVAENDPVVCLLCMDTVPSTYSNLVVDQVLAARDWCVQAATYQLKATAGDGTAPPFADTNVDADKFSAAVTVCANIPDENVQGEKGTSVATDWKDWCLKCLWSPTAQPKPAGTLEYADWKAMQPLTRPTDYGACAFQANQSYYVEAGLSDPVGIRETCVWTADEFQPPVVGGASLVAETITPCLDCMRRTYEYTDMPGGGDQPIGTSKAYACALCRHPNWIKTDVMAKDCFECVYNPNVYNPWGCNHCYEASFLDGVTDATVATACTQCVTDNPYEDKVGSYNWACAECAAIKDPEIKAMCIACIKTPAEDAGYGQSDSEYAAKLGNAEWVGNASEIVCSCVDMAKASTWGTGDLASWYGSACPECTAMQKSCYKRRNITWASVPNHGGVAEDPRIPFIKVASTVDTEELRTKYELLACDADLTDQEKAYLVSVLGGETCDVESGTVDLNGLNCSNDVGRRSLSVVADPGCSIYVPSGAFSGYMLVHLDETIQVNNTGASCVACMRGLTGPSNIGKEDFAYACEQYCMNTYTISNLEEHNQCNTCVAAGAALQTSPAVSPCEMCIQSVSGNEFPDKVDRLARRGDCMACVNGGEASDPNKNWACGECAKMTGTTASKKCLQCLKEEWVDPCACVDGVKRGWLFHDPSGACVVTTGVNTAIANAALMGGMETGGITIETCAKLADAKGAAAFGITNTAGAGTGVTGDCYWGKWSCSLLCCVGKHDIFGFLNDTTGASDTCVCLNTPGKPGTPLVENAGPGKCDTVVCSSSTTCNSATGECDCNPSVACCTSNFGNTCPFDANLVCTGTSSGATQGTCGCRDDVHTSVTCEQRKTNPTGVLTTKESVTPEQLECTCGKIVMQSVVFGRTLTDPKICPLPPVGERFEGRDDLACINTSKDALNLDAARVRCDGNTTCELLPVLYAGANYQGDSCQGTYKYLTVKYTCVA
ncbi:hypothetical protein FOA52_011152 [Chlamydomonas sp. UWO 241]|nr:hypothetical protein FOA52_011152 [Chlamydomonas sp. UWO 241]